MNENFEGGTYFCQYEFNEPYLFNGYVLFPFIRVFNLFFNFSFD